MSDFITRAEVERLLAEQEQRITAQLRALVGVDGKKQPEPPPAPPGPSRIPAWLTWFLVGSAILALFLLCTWRGLLVGFDYDDLMNLHFGWEPPLTKLIFANLTPFSALYRPSGSAYYRICFAIFGWEPQAFRLVTYALLIANIWLVYRLGRRLTGSSEAGVLAALLSSFHPRLRQIYLSNGTIYDVLCGTFTLLTLLYYLDVREKGARQLTIREWIGILALFVLALNAKEMTVFLPPLFFMYEWIYHYDASRTLKSFGAWLMKHADIAAVTMLLSLGAAWVRRSPGSAFYGISPYQPEFTVVRFFQNMRHFYSEMFYFERAGFSIADVVLFWAGLFLIAVWLRRKELTFLAWYIILTPLPVVFFPYRGFFTMYILMFGVAIYTAVLLVAARNWLVRKLWFREATSGTAWRRESVGLFAITAVLVVSGLSDKVSPMELRKEAQAIIAGTKEDIVRLHEPVPRGGRVLILNCRFPADAWGPQMMMQLLYRDRGLAVDRPAMMPKPPQGVELAQYDLVLDHNGEQFVVTRRGSSPSGRGQLLQLPR